jgi:3-methyladenine DNA glycosylase AlkC
VREWAWLAAREHVRQELDQALVVLSGWAEDDAANIRRFASEVTRPRGVWSTHIPSLKREPWLGLEILQRLRADPSRYVQTSVGNWLNDASKDQPRWVVDTCATWLDESPAPTTRWICQKALRTVRRL